MAITFYQAILAFCLQDGGTALIQVYFRHYFSLQTRYFQYLYVDKYLEDFNWVVAVAAIIRVLMSGRTMFIFSKYVYGYVDLAYHTLLVACFLWGLIGVKFIIFLAHALRSIAVTFAIGESRYWFGVISATHLFIMHYLCTLIVQQEFCTTD